MSRRDQIKQSKSELAAFLEEQRIVSVASHGPGGWPHVMPLWYVLRDRELWIYTYGKSQKVKNLERDPRATLLVEDGLQYQELKGVMIEAEAEIVRDFDAVFEVGRELAMRYSGLQAVEGDAAEAIRAQAAKRVAVRFEPRRVASWNHAKLGGVY